MHAAARTCTKLLPDLLGTFTRRRCSPRVHPHRTNESNIVSWLTACFPRQKYRGFRCKSNFWVDRRKSPCKQDAFLADLCWVSSKLQAACSICADPLAPHSNSFFFFLAKRHQIPLIHLLLVLFSAQLGLENIGRVGTAQRG